MLAEPFVPLADPIGRASHQSPTLAISKIFPDVALVEESPQHRERIQTFGRLLAPALNDEVATTPWVETKTR
jgi:hypothetical protein